MLLLAAAPVWASDLTAVKTNDAGGTVVLGSSFDWTISGKNEGTVGADFVSGDVLIRDTLPATNITYSGVSLVGPLHVSCSLAANVLTCTFTGAWSIAPGESYQLRVTGTPSATGIFVNPTGGVCMVDPDGVITESDETNNTASDTVVVGVSAAALTLDKTSDVATYSAIYDVINYSYLVTNSGGFTVSSLAVTDTNVNAPPTCPVSSLAPADFTTCTAAYTVKQADIVAGSITNTASASGNDPSSNLITSPNDSETVAFVPPPPLPSVAVPTLPAWSLILLFSMLALVVFLETRTRHVLRVRLLMKS